MAEAAAPSAQRSDSTLASWWLRLDERSFQTAEEVCSIIFGVSLPPVEDNDESERRKAIAAVLEDVVDESVEFVTKDLANRELKCLSRALGQPPPDLTDASNDANNANDDVLQWLACWKVHFRILVEGFRPLALLEEKFVGSVPGYMIDVQLLKNL